MSEKPVFADAQSAEADNPDLMTAGEDCLAIMVNFVNADTMETGFADVPCSQRNNLFTLCTRKPT